MHRYYGTFAIGCLIGGAKPRERYIVLNDFFRAKKSVRTLVKKKDPQEPGRNRTGGCQTAGFY
jgi:hypothetical protein